MHSRTLVVSLCTSLALGVAAPSQDINISDGNANFTKDFHADPTNFFPGGAPADFLRCDPGGNAAGALFTSAFLYRMSTDTRELPFNDAGGQALYMSFAGVGTATWADMDGRGLFSAIVTYSAVSTGATSGVVIAEAEVTNISASAITLTMFHFVDFDMCGAAFNMNSSSSGSDGRMAHTSTCSETAEHFVRDFDGWETQISGDLYGRLSNITVDNLVNNAGAVGPGDVRSCFQWNNRTIKPGFTETFVVQMAHNDSSCGASATFYGDDAGPLVGSPLAVTRPLIGGSVSWTTSIPTIATTTVLAIGLQRVEIPVPAFGLTLRVNPILVLPLPAQPTVTVSIPSIPALCGEPVYAQFFYINGGILGQTQATKMVLGNY